MLPQAVIFDIGNVLIEWRPERFYDRVIGTDRRAAFFTAIDLHGMNDRVDRGEPFADVITEVAAANPDWADEVRMWQTRWIDMAAPVIDDSVRILRALRRTGVPVFALSNFGIETFEIGRENYPVLEEFDRHYISGHMGVTKPDPRIYEMVEEDCGLSPERLLFTDDRAENIGAARARGWQGHHFDGPSRWGERLIAEGLITQEGLA
jgi:2-haloacid dehalogenase